MVFEATTFVHFNSRGGLLFNGEGGGDARVRVLHHVDEIIQMRGQTMHMTRVNRMPITTSIPRGEMPASSLKS